MKGSILALFSLRVHVPVRPTDPQGLLEGGGLVLSVFDDGGVGAAALAAPHLLAAAGVPVLVGGLSQLGSHFHQVVGVGFHQGLGGKEPKVWRGGGEKHIHTQKKNHGEQLKALLR